MNSVLENLNTGEHKATKMFIQWSGHGLIRFDVYCYRCNFYSNEVIKNFKGAIGVILIKRIINLTVTDPQLLASTIYNQIKSYPKITTDTINEVVTIINTIRTTANKLEFIMSTSYIQNIDNFCCKLLHAYAERCTSKTKCVKNKKRKGIKKRQRKRKLGKKK